MADVDGYQAWDPPRLCDTCGDLYRMSQMRRLPGNVWSCTERCAGERTATELARANARQKPFLYRPVKNAKPEDPYNPDTFEADDAAILNFIGRMVAAQCRYESVVSGVAAPVSGHALDGLSWAARYLYGVITDNHRLSTFVGRAKTLLKQIADYLLTRQWGSATGPFSAATIANDPFFGAFLESGGSTYLTDNTSTSGLALIYAYRVFGTASYLTGARAAATFLRNVQAIGSCAVVFTSSNAAGTTRFYTGGLMSETKRTVDIDLGLEILGNHLFYPSGLLALEFWNELTKTDGDQLIGCTATSTGGFAIVPSQLMSQCMTDLRNCWTNGITQQNGVTLTGLSSSTPREFFNAYPAAKTGFTIGGSGMWEFQDGGANTGTLVSSLNFAQALSSLYAVDGASTLVTTVDDWMRSFANNTAYATPSEDDGLLQRATTGTFDATVCPSTLLMVRDATNSYAATAKNGSSLYDWGAFGVLSSLWAARHATNFGDARRSACGIRLRFHDGQRSDGDYHDRISLRGMSGLSYQTNFTVSSTNFGSFENIPTAPDSTHFGYWYKSDSGITKNGSNQVTDWTDKTGNGWDLHTPSGGNTPPVYTPNALGSLPGIYFGSPSGGASNWSLVHYGPPFNVPVATFPSDSPYPFTRTEAHVVYVVAKVLAGAPPGGGTGGGMLVQDRFSRQVWTLSGTQQRYARAVATILQTNPSTSYSGNVVLFTYIWDGANLLISVNDFSQLSTIDNTTGLASTSLPAPADGAHQITVMVGDSTIDAAGFQGYIFEVILDKAAAVNQRTVAYLAGLYGSPSTVMANDVVRASMFGLSLRQAPRSTGAPSA